jgi:hypothetical protein
MLLIYAIDFFDGEKSAYPYMVENAFLPKNEFSKIA